MSNNSIWGFDLGKKSIGACSRNGENIEFLQSYTFDLEYADPKEWRPSRKTAKRTRCSHKKREENLNKFWTELGWKIPNIQNQTLLIGLNARLQILHNNIVSTDQLYLALYSVIQHRGYDDNLPWLRKKTKKKNQEILEQEETKQNENKIEKKELTEAEKDELENKKKLQTFEKLFSDLNLNLHENYISEFEALKLGIWEGQNKKVLIPDKFVSKIRGLVVYPRQMIIKEAQTILEKASLKFTELKDKINYILWGNSLEAYKNKPHHLEGILGQKIPRFNNRIMSRCRLFERFNTCQAKDKLAIETKLLLILKNLRYQKNINEEPLLLNFDEFTILFEKCRKKLENKSENNQKITITELYEILVNEKIWFERPLGKQEKSKEKLKALFNLARIDKDGDLKIKTEGRFSLCRTACRLLKDYLLGGLNKTEFVENRLNNENWKKNFDTNLTESEIINAINRFGNSWESFSISDEREELLNLGTKQERHQFIEKLLGKINNYVVKNRLQIFYNLIRFMENKLGEPKEVLIEFVKNADSSFLPQKDAKSWEKFRNENQKENNIALKHLREAGIPKPSFKDIVAYKLLKEQHEKCLYSGEGIEIADWKDGHLEIDHIIPRSFSHCDAFYNLVLVKKSCNSDKGNKTPFEYLNFSSSGGKLSWEEYRNLISNNKKIKNKKRKLLLSQNKEGLSLIENWNGLAETAHIAKICQKILCIYFSWGMQVKDQDRKVFTTSGSQTAQLRNWYSLNEFLHEEKTEKPEAEKEAESKTEENTENKKKTNTKNRGNDKHHALDAFCLTLARLKNIQFEDERGLFREKSYKDGFPIDSTRKLIKQYLDNLIPLTLKTNKAKQFPEETIYSARLSKNNKKPEIPFYDIVVKKNLKEFLLGQIKEETENNKKRKQDEDQEQEEENKTKLPKISEAELKKRIEKIYHQDIKIILYEELRQNGLEAFIQKVLNQEIIHNRFKSPIKKVLTVTSKENTLKIRTDNNNKKRITLGEFADYSKEPEILEVENKKPKNIQLFKTKAHKGQLVYLEPKKNELVARIRPIYGFESLNEIKEELQAKGYELYSDRIFNTGCYLKIENDFAVGDKKFKAGIYKLRTMTTSGTVKLENLNGTELETTINTLVKAGFKRLELCGFELKV